MESLGNDNSDKDFEYGKQLRIFETSNLKVGDFLTVNTASGSRFVFKVLSTENNQVKVKCVEGAEEFLNREDVIMNGKIFVNGRILFGMDLSDVTQAIRIEEIIVTNDISAQIKDMVSGVIELWGAELVSGEIYVPDPIRPYISPNVLEDNYRQTLERLGVNLSESLTEGDIKEAWYRFKKRFNDPEEKQKVIEEFEDTFIHYPPTDIALSILYKGVLFKVNFIISFYFKGEKIDG